MNEQANIDVVKQCYDAFQKGDIQRLMSCMADDVDWELPKMDMVPFAGKRRGREQVTEFFRLIGESQDVREFRPQDFIAQGDRVVVTGHYEWTVKQTGADFGSDWTHVFTVVNGKVVKFKEFTDTYQAALAYQPGLAGAIGAGERTAATRTPIH